MAIGSSFTLYVEELEDGIWRNLTDYPFAGFYIQSYSTVTLNEELYLFGTFSIVFSSQFTYELKEVHMAYFQPVVPKKLQNTTALSGQELAHC